MTASKPYLSEIEAPSRAEVDALTGLTLIEFGTSWCGHCRVSARVQYSSGVRAEGILREWSQS
jgi:thiol-disulfide isomerase/thioredoxin